MSRARKLLLGGALLGSGLLGASCGGSTSKRGPDTAVGGSNAAGSSSGGSSSGGSGLPSAGKPAAGSTGMPQGCDAMDARSNGTRCVDIAGYTFNGATCEPVFCGCAGAECDAIFSSMDGCDRAHDSCYSRAGLARNCSKHADCRLDFRTCCGQCEVQLADQLIAVRSDSAAPGEVGACLEPDEACRHCTGVPNPSIYSACIEGTCSVVDVTAEAKCETEADCMLVSKDCCDCGGDFSSFGVMAVSQAYQRPARCAGVGCDGCLPSASPNVNLSCNGERSLCELLLTLL